MSQKEVQKHQHTFLIVIITIVSLLVFYPIVMMIIVSLKTDTALTTAPFGLTIQFQWQNYADAFNGMNYPTALRTSVILTAVSAVSATILSALGSYAIVRVTRGKKLFVLFNILFLVGLALPQQVAMVPMVLWLQKLGLGGTVTGVCLVYIAANAAYGIFFFSGFINTVPVSLEDAARIDGASPFTVFRKVVFPLLKAPSVTLLIIMVLRVWNDFMYPLILLQGKNSRTLPLTIYLFKGDYSTQWNVMFAATTLAIIPLMVVYFIFQKKIISGMLSGAVKM